MRAQPEKPARERRGSRELALFGALYVTYDVGRWLSAGGLAVAQAHAHWVLEIERSAHIAIEPWVQRAFSGSVAAFVLSNVYFMAQLLVLPAALIWLYWRSPDTYRSRRKAEPGFPEDIAGAARALVFPVARRASVAGARGRAL